MARILGINGRIVGVDGNVLPHDNAPCCCQPQPACFAKYHDCIGFADVWVRYVNGCPPMHPQVIYWLAGDPNHRCYFFVEETSIGGFPVLDPAQILETFDDCKECADDPPPPPQTGACCTIDGGCVQTSQEQCLANNGSYQGDGTGCLNIVCPTGACCLPGGGCVQSTIAACQAVGGLYQGNGTQCGLVNCPGEPPPPGAPVPPPGVGTTIESLIKWVSRGKIKPCAGCIKRRDTLNKWFPGSV